MTDPRGVLGYFDDPARAARAIRALRASGLSDVRAAMPAPFPAVTEALGHPRSRLGFGVFFGTVAGVIAGYGLCAWTSTDWPLVTGGKPILSWPAFTVIGFEVAVLVGGLTTHGLLALQTALSRSREIVPIRDPRFCEDRIGVFTAGDPAVAERVLREEGAEEVRYVG